MDTIESEIVKQSQNIDLENWRCSTCKFYGGRCICKMGVFIAFVGGDLSRCTFYQYGETCPHCGKNF